MTDHERSLAPLGLLELATLLSGTGNSAAAVLLPWLVLERTGSAGSAGILAAATAVPLLASSLFSGAVVDTVGRRRTSVGSDVLSAASVAAIPLVDRFIGVNLAWLVGLAIVGAVFDPAGVTARETMLPAAAARAGWSLDRANGVHEAIWGTSFLLGPGLGGVLIGWVGAANGLWVTAVGFVASAAAGTAIRVSDAGRPAAEDVPESIWRGTVDGLAFVWRDHLLRDLTLLAVVLVAAYLPIEAVLLPVHFERLHQGGRLGILVMAMGAGSVLGSLGYGVVGDRIGRRALVFRVALVATGVLVLVVALRPGFVIMVIAGFGFGFTYGPVELLVTRALQTRSPEEIRGRIFGVVASADYAAGPIGYLLVGAGVQHFGLGPTFVAVGVAVCLTAVAGLRIRSISQLDDPMGALPVDIVVPGSGHAPTGTRPAAAPPE